MIEMIGTLVTHPLTLSLVIIAGGAYIIYLLVAKKGPVGIIANNHLSGMPEMALTLVAINNELQQANQLQLQLLSIVSRIEGKLDH